MAKNDGVKAQKTFERATFFSNGQSSSKISFEID